MAPEPDIHAAKQGLRNQLSTIIRDFDRHGGAFAALDYRSPWDMITEDWADRTGRTVEELRETITAYRVARVSGHEPDVHIKETFDDFRRAAEEWRSETGYQDPPIRLTKEDRRFPNYKQLKAHLVEAGKGLGFEEHEVTYAIGDLSLGGRFHDRFGHRVSVSMDLKLWYGGEIRLWFGFPYHGPGELILSLLLLTGSAHLRILRLPEMPELEWIASKSATDFRQVDGVIAIMQAIIGYLKPTLQ